MFAAIASAARGLKRGKDMTREIYGIVCLDSPNIQVSSRKNDIHFAFDTGTSAPSSICSTVETNRLNNLPSTRPPTKETINPLRELFKDSTGEHSMFETTSYALIFIFFLLFLIFF